jgi:hypothetical protein
MRLARGNRDHPVVVAEATAVVEDMAADAAKVASEEATRNSHALSAIFVAPEKLACRGGCCRAQG